MRKRCNTLQCSLDVIDIQKVKWVLVWLLYKSKMYRKLEFQCCNSCQLLFIIRTCSELSRKSHSTMFHAWIELHKSLRPSSKSEYWDTKLSHPQVRTTKTPNLSIHSVRVLIKLWELLDFPKLRPEIKVTKFGNSIEEQNMVCKLHKERDLRDLPRRDIYPNPRTLILFILKPFSTVTTKESMDFSIIKMEERVSVEKERRG